MEKVSLKSALDKAGLIVIDGSMGTLLERKGCNLKDSLWTAMVLAKQPDLVREVHLDYFRAGADCGITCSYQATIPGLLAKGFSQDEAENLIVNSVRLFQEAREQWWEKEGGKDSGRAYPICLAGIGPYGAYLADGSEYRGDYTVSDEELREFHFRRSQLLWDAGADVLLFETQPSLREAKILAAIGEELGADYWISFSCRNGHEICDGTPITQCAKELSEGYPHLKMIGVNCTAPQYIESLIRDLKSACDIPIGVYPNSGEVYDPVEKVWRGDKDALPFVEYARRYMDQGAVAVGGCCTTVPEHIEGVAKVREQFQKEPRKIHL